MAKRFPNESEDYRRARDELLEAEKRLRRQMEDVAALRRKLPPGGKVPEDYEFQEAGRKTKLSELFGDKDTLVLYSYMFGPKMEKPCPSCSSILDALDGETPHILQRVAFAVVVRTPIDRAKAFAAQRGWRNLRLVSSADNSFNTDYFAESENGSQNPLLHVFTKKNGEIRHFWSSELLFAGSDPGQDPRHVDVFWPLWHLFDATPEGRGDFQPKLAYGG